MASDMWDHEIFAVMKSEQEELTDVLAEIREVVAADGRSRNCVDDLMSRLSDLIDAKFCHEEEGGYLKEALDREPDLAMRVGVLMEQHDSLREEVEKLRLLVHSGMETPAWWARVEADFHKFTFRLLSHEYAESKIVQDAKADNVGL